MPPAPGENEPTNRRRTRAMLLRVALSAAFVLALAWALHRMGLAALGETLRHAAWPLVALAAALQLVPLTLARALRWRALLPPHPSTRASSLAFVVLGSQAMSNVLPLRAGEAYRTIALQRRGLPIDRVLASQAGEKLTELASLAVFALPLLFAPAVLRAGSRAAIGIAAAAALVLAVVVFVRRARRGGALARRVAAALESLRSPSAWLKAFAFALAADAVDLAMVALSARAVGVAPTLVLACAVLVCVNLAIAIPAAPGQIGTLEAGAVAALVAFGAPDDRALAFALVYHAVHVVPGTLAGGLALAAARPRARTEALP